MSSSTTTIEITIPNNWLTVYNQLSYAMADYGYEMLLDCQACCKAHNIELLKCYSMFQAAVSAYNIGESSTITLANNLILEIAMKLTNLKTNN